MAMMVKANCLPSIRASNSPPSRSPLFQLGGQRFASNVGAVYGDGLGESRVASIAYADAVAYGQAALLARSLHGMDELPRPTLAH